MISLRSVSHFVRHTFSLSVVVAALCWSEATTAACGPTCTPNTGYPWPVCGCLDAADLNAAIAGRVPVASGNGNSITLYGAVADGSTDAGPAINQCLIQSTVPCLVPPSTAGFYINTPVQVTNIPLIGMVYYPSNPTLTVSTQYTFPGSSFLLCSPTVSPCVQMGVGAAGASGNLNQSPILANLVVGRVGYPAATGTIGIEWFGGYNGSSYNTLAYNHGTCEMWQSVNNSGGIFNHFNLQAARCSQHFLTIDGDPEINFFGGRLGNDGPGESTNTAVRDFVWFTASQQMGPGGGPNTIRFRGMNWTTAAQVDCAMRWANMTTQTTPGVISEFYFDGVHIEWHTSPAPTGIFCTDNTMPLWQYVYVDHMVSSTYNSTTNAFVPVFALNPVTALSNVHFSNNDISNCNGTATLAPTPVSGPAFNFVYFQGNDFCGPVKFTSNGVGSNTLLSTGNAWSFLTVGGSWKDFESHGDRIDGMTDTARGNVAIGTAQNLPFTPALAFTPDGTTLCTTGITYSSQVGFFKRNADGGWKVSYSFILTNKGSCTGNAVITGLPTNAYCSAGTVSSAGTPAYATGMVGMTSAIVTILGSGNPVPYLNVYQAGPTGLGVVNNTNFSNTSLIAASAECPQAT